MKLKCDQNVYLITEEDGEWIGTIDKGNEITTRSPKQQENDKTFSPFININSEERFLKLITANLSKLLKETRKSQSTFFAFSVMIPYIRKNSNYLVKSDDTYFTIKDLADEMGVSRQMAYLHIKKLKSLNVIAEKQTKQGKVLVVNPYYACASKTIRRDIVDLFETTKATFRNDKTCDIPDGDSKNVNDD